MTITLSIPDTQRELKPRIVVVGVGGAGGNAVNNMIAASLEGVEFLACNTDAQALCLSKAQTKIQLGIGITQGLGAGSRPDVGRAAAEEGLDAIMQELGGAHMVFITAGMGGGTGTGGAPVLARAARETGILTVGVVTKPFHFEGAHRMRLAEQGIEELQHYVDTLIVIPNQNLFRVANEKTTFAEAFKMADNVLYSGVRGVTDLMVVPGLINLDFADIRTVMSEMGKAMMGTGEAEGERRALDAAEAAISNPLLDDVSMKGARGVLVNITGGADLTLFEVDEAANRIRDEVDPEANIIVGSAFDPLVEGKVRISVVATGIESAAMQQPKPTRLAVVSDRPAARVMTPGGAVLPAAVGATMAAPPAANEAARMQPRLEPVLSATAPAPVMQPARPAYQQPAQPVYHQMSRPVAQPPVTQPMAPVMQPRAIATPVMAPPAPAPVAAMVEEEAIEPEPATMAQHDAEQAAAASSPMTAGLIPIMSESRTAAPEPRRAKRRISIFERVASGVRAVAEVPPAETPAPVQQRLGGLEPAERPLVSKAEDDLLEIPAFLRRHVN
jgi:cell division protein FtsZ